MAASGKRHARTLDPSTAAATCLTRATAMDRLSGADYFHHLVFIPTIAFPGQVFRWGALGNFQAFFISGLPGGLDYCMLGLQKVGMLNAMTEKRVNANLNTWLRTPGILTSTVLLYQALKLGRYQVCRGGSTGDSRNSRPPYPPSPASAGPAVGGAAPALPAAVQRALLWQAGDGKLRRALHAQPARAGRARQEPHPAAHVLHHGHGDHGVEGRAQRAAARLVRGPLLRWLSGVAFHLPGTVLYVCSAHTSIFHP